jgi:hypothetical protein
MKAMAIIGIVLSSISLVGVLAAEQISDVQGWGVVGLGYALAFSIVVLVSIRKRKTAQ